MIESISNNMISIIFFDIWNSSDSNIKCIWTCCENMNIIVWCVRYPFIFLNQEFRRDILSFPTGTKDREHLFSNLEVHCQSLVSRCSFNSISRHDRIKLTSVRSFYWKHEKTIDRKSDSFDYPPIKNVRFILKYKLWFHWFWIGIISFTIFASTQKTFCWIFIIPGILIHFRWRYRISNFVVTEKSDGSSLFQKLVSDRS